jgi:phosphate:Na+ symporter
LDLIAKEHLRLARRLRVYSDAMRAAPAMAERQEALRTHEPFATLAERIAQFQHELVNQPLGPHEAERLTSLQSRLSLLVYLEDSLQTLAATTESVSQESRLGVRVSTFVEALDFVLLTLIDALESGAGEPVDQLVQITEDRGEFVERVRQEYLSDEASVTASDRAVLSFR